MITHDNKWHDRMANAAEVAAADRTIETRLKFYIDLIMSNPSSPASPYANARGILANVLGYTDDEAYHHIQNEITLASQRKKPEMFVQKKMTLFQKFIDFLWTDEATAKQIIRECLYGDKFSYSGYVSS